MKKNANVNVTLPNNFNENRFKFCVTKDLRQLRDACIYELYNISLVYYVLMNQLVMIVINRQIYS